jgi:hypothetical protein
MEIPEHLSAISGAAQLFEWFGRWPSFHDAEILSLHLDRSGTSSLSVHTWAMTNQVDAKGYFLLEKQLVVEFLLEEIFDLELNGFNHQNVLSRLDIEKAEEGFRLVLGDCYGLAGTIDAKIVAIRLNPGKPISANA